MISPEMTKKVAIARLLITRAIRESGADHCAVANSWGKDSLVVLHLVREQLPDVLVVHCNTGVDHPLTYKFRNRLVKEWGLNYIEAKAPKQISCKHPETKEKMTVAGNFWAIADVYGLPGIRLVGGSRVPRCCQYLKDDPGDKLYIEHGIKCIFDGITASESHNRFMLSHRCGDYYFAKTANDRTGAYKCHPIMSWTTEQVWEYIRGNGLPYNEFYDRFPGHRVGCKCCTSYLDWEENMPLESPRDYEKIMGMLGRPLPKGKQATLDMEG